METYRSYLEAMGFVIISCSSETNRKGYSSGRHEDPMPLLYTKGMLLTSYRDSARNDYDFSSSSGQTYLCHFKDRKVDYDALAWDLYEKFNLICGIVATTINADIRRMNYLDKLFFDYPSCISHDHFHSFIDGVPHYYICKYSKDTNRLTTVDQEIAKHKAKAEAGNNRTKRSKELVAWVKSTHDIPRGAQVYVRISPHDDSVLYVVNHGDISGEGKTPKIALACLEAAKTKHTKVTDKRLKELNDKLASVPTPEEILMMLRERRQEYSTAMHYLSAELGFNVDTLWHIFKRETGVPWEISRIKDQIETLEQRKKL